MNPLVPFTAKTVTVYRGGGTYPFRPGEPMTVPETHLETLKAHDDRATARAELREADAES